ncbi:MAG: aminopeptidase P family protein [bacterium]
MFPATTYASRRQQLRQQVKNGVLFFLGNTESPMNYTDNAYPFRQDSTFLYFFGLDAPDLVAVIDTESGEEILFGNDFTMNDIIWMGPQPSMQDKADQVGVQQVQPMSKLEEYLQKAIAQSRTVHHLPPYRAENAAAIERLLGIERGKTKESASISFIKGIVTLRSIKSSEELEELERALAYCSAMHTAAMKTAKEGMYEFEVAGLIEGTARACGGRISFPVILTIHGETLHNHYYGNMLSSGKLVINDSGAETAMHYAGDITRTFPVDKHFTQQQKEIYSIVLRTNETTITAVRPGIPFKEVHLLAARTIASGLKELGIMKGDVDEAVTRGAHALFLPHGLGHMLGLDVHDMEDLGEDSVGYGETMTRSTQFGLRSLRMARTLEPGHVITIEPGIYFIPALIDLWKSENKFTQFIEYGKLDAYRSYGGTRIEDDIVVTNNGGRIIGQPIPKSIAEIEAMRAS